MNLKLLAAAAIAVAGAAGANAAAVTLTFDELNGAINESPLNYYNGGFGSAGTGPGPALGYTFSSNTITGVTQPNAGANTNSAGNPSGANVIFFLSGGASTLDVAAGFTTGFSFYYSAVFQPGFINVYDGLDATGNILATLALPTTTDGAATAGCYGTNFCPFVPLGVTFSGTAKSIDFGGTDNQIGFDNITFGSATPGSGTPEPAAWALMITGFGLVGTTLRRRRTGVVAA